MSFLFPRVAFASPARCGPARHEIVPLFSLFDDTFNELQRVQRHARRQFNPRFNVKETKDSYDLEGELPGIEQKNISVEFTDEHTLTIKGRTETRTESGKRPEALAAAAERPTDAIEEGTTTTPAAEAETDSIKSHQATVEDEEPANSSAADEKTTEVAAPAPTSQQPAKAEKPKEQHWISERSVGEFSRSFRFPARIDQEAVKASLKNGILSIVVPKAAVPESRRINVE